VALEKVTWISELQKSDPKDTDLVSQGDDHIRLIKSVLQNSFPVALDAPLIPSIVGNNDKVLTVNSDQTAIVWEETKSETPPIGTNFFRYWKSANQTESSNQWTKIIFDTMMNDSDGVWANTSFTIPADGLYYMDFCSRITEAALPDHDFALFVNEADFKQLSYTDYQSGDNKFHSVQMSAVFEAKANDDISFRMKSESSLTLGGSNNSLSAVSGYRIR